MADPATSCPPLDALAIATEHLTDEIYRRSSVPMVMENLIPRKEWTSGIGLTSSSFIAERSEPTVDEATWSAISSIALAGGTASCSNSWQDLNYGLTRFNYSPEQFSMRGPIICEEELIYTHLAARFLERYLDALAVNSRRQLDNRLTTIYMHLSPKASATADYFQADGGAFDADNTPPTSADWSGIAGHLPTSQLTQDMLDLTAATLNVTGASNPDEQWIQLGPDGPIYPLLIGQTASQAIQLNNSEFRHDYRFAEPSALLKRMGATRVIKNFRHIIWLTPPRYTEGPVGANGQTVTRLNTWEMVAATKGFKARLRADYRAGAYEVALVLNPWVFHQEIVRPPGHPAGIPFDTKSYMGEWQLRIGGREICEDSTTYDPLKKIARHFAEYKMASEPIFPEYGRAILFKKCPVTSFSLVTCAGVS